LSPGYKFTKPPAVSVNRTDPGSGQAYAIITSSPSTTGQIYYKAGGKCAGGSITPGSFATKYVALLMKLEGQSDLYCVDIQ
jgi:hypothetical protein